MAQSDMTTDHEEIRQWAEKRGGTPSSVKGTGNKSEAGVLRLDFAPRDEDLEEISWDEFFDKFEQEKLAFLYQDKTANGRVSRFHKFVARNQQTENSGKTMKTTTKAAGASKSAKTTKAAPAAKSEPAKKPAAKPAAKAAPAKTASPAKSSAPAKAAPKKAEPPKKAEAPKKAADTKAAAKPKTASKSSAASKPASPAKKTTKKS